MKAYVAETYLEHGGNEHGSTSSYHRIWSVTNDVHWWRGRRRRQFAQQTPELSCLHSSSSCQFDQNCCRAIRIKINGPRSFEGPVASGAWMMLNVLRTEGVGVKSSYINSVQRLSIPYLHLYGMIIEESIIIYNKCYCFGSLWGFEGIRFSFLRTYSIKWIGNAPCQHQKSAGEHRPFQAVREKATRIDDRRTPPALFILLRTWKRDGGPD